MGADQSKQLENTLFNLKFSAKSLVRESKKCEKAEKEEKAKVKKAIQKGNTEGARIYAENAIRNKNQVFYERENFIRNFWSLADYCLIHSQEIRIGRKLDALFFQRYFEF